jgi:hypothetical protein
MEEILLRAEATEIVHLHLMSRLEIYGAAHLYGMLLT